MNAPKLEPAVGSQDHVQGPRTAPVTLVEFGDYQCPYCGQAHTMVKDIQHQLGDQLQFVFRNFPLTDSHPYALQAAEAAEAAGEQDRFWQMHDRLYEHQNELDRGHLIEHARALGLDMDAFERALETHAEIPHIQQDVESGEQSEIQGTPTFFINGQPYDGPYDTNALLAAIREHMRS